MKNFKVGKPSISNLSAKSFSTVASTLAKIIGVSYLDKT